QPTKCIVKMAVGKFDYFNSLQSILPSHLESKVFNEFKGKSQGYDQNSLYTKNPTLPGLYHGPYVVSEVKLSSHVIFTPNPHFYGKKPAIKKIIVKLIANTGTMDANLQAGNVDMIPPAAGFGNDQAVAFEKRVKSQNLPFEVQYTDGLIYAHIDMNLTNPILSDLRVRKAISMAIDKKVITENLLEGKAKEAIHFATQKDPWFTDQTTIYKYDKKEARKLLDAAGWKMGASGIREKDGKKLQLTMMAVAGNKFIENIQAYFKENFRSIGLDLAIKNEPGRVFFSDTTKRRKFDMALFSWVSIPEQTPRSILHTESIPTEKNSWAGQNFTSFSN
ncbi:MAG: ABC transporter substrate-binding protein, partial [Pseudobdellovibrionaceae bacterium]